ncbi:hypothetical protein DPMN_044504 [Dreissena polymorpha]|uniref:Uncharacterized protein n=1 Tax=Dreissena polymorpha TaxID=45954 RepID=A0A9D4I0K1_DREPO|nr:hypothetical protein DPMN_044504 [Dreissena polymorpha]
MLYKLYDNALVICVAFSTYLTLHTLQATKKVIKEGISGAQGGASSTTTATATLTTSTSTAWDHASSSDDDEEQEEAPQEFLTREHCIGLAPSARVMKGRRSCK